VGNPVFFVHITCQKLFFGGFGSCLGKTTCLILKLIEIDLGKLLTKLEQF
jgi:hypothetical protein